MASSNDAGCLSVGRPKTFPNNSTAYQEALVTGFMMPSSSLGLALPFALSAFFLEACRLPICLNSELLMVCVLRLSGNRENAETSAGQNRWFPSRTSTNAKQITLHQHRLPSKWNLLYDVVIMLFAVCIPWVRNTVALQLRVDLKISGLFNSCKIRQLTFLIESV